VLLVELNKAAIDTQTRTTQIDYDVDGEAHIFGQQRTKAPVQLDSGL